ncbi:hypothetical protein J3R83DRAFT_10385 [Lanmaoa asiatica]|nr:hypothetical protein J3R83DRAFT_10385 [Lanmaoa asiatica]
MAASAVISAVPPAHSAPIDKYRGAVVEDLQLPPAFSLPADEYISRAIELAYERDFSQIPVLDKNRRPLGYVDAVVLKEKWQAGYAKPDDTVKKYMSAFKRNESHPYTIITPDTPLAELAEFLRDNIFALGEATQISPTAQWTDSDLVTDSNRKFVLAVATSQDLENFVSRRGI